VLVIADIAAAAFLAYFERAPRLMLMLMLLLLPLLLPVALVLVEDAC
jgi:hypothetical protein